MEFDEWYDRMMDNGDSPLHYLVTQREKLRLAWNESRRISDNPILSAVPSGDTPEPCKHRYDSLKINWANQTSECENCGKELDKRGIAG